MEYLFLRRRNKSSISERQKHLLSKAVEKQWKMDLEIYKSLLYQLEIRMVFLDASLSLKKLSTLVGTNQTYMSNVVNRYFGCNMNGVINTYRIEYAKELLRSGKCLIKDISERCGFASKSAFYSAFRKITGYRPVEYVRRNGVEEKFGKNN